MCSDIQCIRQHASGDKDRTETSAAMSATGVPAQPAHVWSNEDADLSGGFGELLREVPKELLTKIVPAERTVMLCRVSKGARTALAGARQAAVVKARGGHTRIAGLEEGLREMMSWCMITVLDLSGVWSQAGRR